MRSYLIRPGASPGGPDRGRLAVPGDKSISHRAVMLGAIAQGTTRIRGFLESADCRATLAAFAAMGVAVSRDHGDVLIDGVGLHGLRAPEAPLDVGNAGTSMRLLAGLLAGQRFDVTLTGDASLRRRPMDRVIAPLRRMGAQIDADTDADAGECAPLRLRGGNSLRGIDYAMPVASAQVKSCLLLAGLYAEGVTRVREPAPCRDHTERMLAAFGVALEQRPGQVALTGGGSLSGRLVEVPGDLSSAAFLIIAAAVTPGSDLLIENVGINPTRTGVLDILAAMGADIARENPREIGGEPVADLRVRGGPLHGIEIDPALVPLAIDEFPALFVAAACAEGDTVLRGAAELRVKESDRIAVMAAGLAALGIVCQVYEDGIRITGGRFTGGAVNSHGDHRVAMAFAVAGSRADGPVRIADTANVATSFPGFVETARAAGIDIEETGAA